MPMDRRKYPTNWEAISHRIRFERAGGKCEQCGAPNSAEIVRSTFNPGVFIIADDIEPIFRWPDGQRILPGLVPDHFPVWEYPYVRVVLTVHHIGVDKLDGSPGSPDDKMDCRDENLIALCQRCHLLADMPRHVQARHRTLLEKKAAAKREAGQMELFE